MNRRRPRAEFAVLPPGKLIRTLSSYPFAVDAKTGNPQIDLPGPYVQAWANSTTLITNSGCCSESDIHLVPTTAPSRPSSWPTVDGTEDATAIGVRHSSVLVVRPWDVKGADNIYRRGGMQVLWRNSARPRGQVIKRIPGENVYADKISDSLNRTYGATPVNITPKTFPYKGTGTVVAAAV